MMMKNHRELEQLSAYLDGELDAGAQAHLESHLPGCAECRATLDALRTTVTELRALDEPARSQHDSWALRAAIARARARPARWGRVAAALGGVAAVAIGFVAFGQFASTSSRDTGGALREAASDSGPAVPLRQVNFNEDSARALLLGTVDQAYDAPQAEAAPGAAISDDTMVTGRAAEEPADVQGRPKARAQFDRIDWHDALTRCTAVVTEGAAADYALRESFGARYEGEPALFLVYDVQPPDGDARAELWVMEPSNCDLVFWAQS